MSAQRLRRMRPAAVALSLAMLCFVAASIWLIGSLFDRAAATAQQPLSAARLDAADSSVLNANRLWIAAYLVCAVGLAVVLYLAGKNIERSGQLVTQPPWLALFTWIPIVHWVLTPLVLTYLVGRSAQLATDRSTFRSDASRPKLLTTAYAVYLLAAFVGFGGRSQQDRADLESFAGGDRAIAIGTGLLVVSGVMLAVIVWRMADHQDAHTAS